LLLSFIFSSPNQFFPRDSLKELQTSGKGMSPMKKLENITVSAQNQVNRPIPFFPKETEKKKVTGYASS